MRTRPAAVLLGLILCSADVWAGTVAVPYAGTFDEASVPAQGGLPAGGADYLGSTDTVSAAPFTRGEGIYRVLIGNGTFGCCYGSSFDIPVEYAMPFTVEKVALPVPATVSLFSAAFAGLLLVSWWKQR